MQNERSVLIVKKKYNRSIQSKHQLASVYINTIHFLYQRILYRPNFCRKKIIAKILKDILIYKIGYLYYQNNDLFIRAQYYFQWVGP